MLRTVFCKILILLALGLSSPVTAKYAAIVMNAQTGEVLHEEHADKITHPASLTKMMTLYILFSVLDQGKIKLDTMIPVSAHAARQAPSKLGLKPGESIRVRDAIMALITKSANDVAAAVGEKLGQTEAGFAAVMTAQAHQLGMTNTYFYNASGLPHTKQITTARDMAVLSRALIREFSHHYHLFRAQNFVYKGKSHRNHNKLAGKMIAHAQAPVVIDGIKTGYINASGYNLAASAMHGDQRLIVVVMGGETGRARDKRIKDLMAHYFGARPVGEKNADQRFTQPTIHLAQYKPTDKSLRQLSNVVNTRRHRQATTISAKFPIKHAVQKHTPRQTGWAAQVGAFRKLTDARRALKVATRNAPEFIKKSNPIAVPSRAKKRTVYRAQLAGLTQSQATQACQAFSARGMECLALRTHRS